MDALAVDVEGMKIYRNGCGLRAEYKGKSIYQVEYINSGIYKVPGYGYVRPKTIHGKVESIIYSRKGC